jgi:hypothetical protein
MTLEDLIAQWRAARDGEFSPGLHEAADELEDWLGRHRPASVRQDIRVVEAGATVIGMRIERS